MLDDFELDDDFDIDEDENVDLVEVNVEKPEWRYIQSFRYKIERREAQKEKLQQEIEEYYQQIANLRAGCKPGDLIEYKSDSGKVKFVEDVEAIDFKDALVYLCTFNSDGSISDDMKQYPARLVKKNYKVICSMNSFAGF